MQGTRQINKSIIDIKMENNCFQGVLPLLKVCTDPLTEDNNRNFARGSPTDLFFGLFGQRDRVETIQSGVWIDFYFPLHFSDYIYIYILSECYRQT